MDIPFQTCDRLRAEFAHRRLPPKIAQAKCHRRGRSRQTRAHSTTLGPSPSRYPATPRLRLRGRSVDARHFLRRPFVPCPAQRASNAQRAPSPRRQQDSRSAASSLQKRPSRQARRALPCVRRAEDQRRQGTRRHVARDARASRAPCQQARLWPHSHGLPKCQAHDKGHRDDMAPGLLPRLLQPVRWVTSWTRDCETGHRPSPCKLCP